MLPDRIRVEIISLLTPLNIEKVILFGSYASENQTANSDIDLYVVTKDEFIPQTFKEKMAMKMAVSRVLRNLKKIMDIDLIVHTKLMHEKFIELGSSFSREITEKGIPLL